MGFPGGSDGKESTCNVGDMGSIPRMERSSGEGKGYPLQYSGLENSMKCIVHGVSKRQTWLRNFHFQVYNLVLLTIVTMLYFRSPEAIHLTGESLYFDQCIPIYSIHESLKITIYSMFLWGQCFRYHIQVRPYNIHHSLMFHLT